ncbi:MAG: HD domain-containing protein [Anaerolineales bacterium]|nr:HD domain-containing protein [Anaerolineales bacterium]
MKTVFISDLAAGTELTNELFLLQEVARRTTKDGRPYLLCTVRDNSGQMGAVFWNVPPYIEGWATTGAPVLVAGRVVTYKDSLQLNLTDMNPAPEPDLSVLLPASSRPRSEMLAELQEQIAGLGQPWRDLLTHILLSAEFMPTFASAPAARVMHHAYIGGLLEHTLSMARLARVLARHYPQVNEDLLVSGVLLHDMGKAFEYNLQGGFEITEDGRLVGHILRALLLVDRAAIEIGFPETELQHLTHLIASHHGTQEWGSPTVPKTLEAILLHQVDLLDSRVQGYFDHIKNDNLDGAWTKSSLMFGTELRRPPAIGTA